LKSAKEKDKEVESLVKVNHEQVEEALLNKFDVRRAEEKEVEGIVYKILWLMNNCSNFELGLFACLFDVCLFVCVTFVCLCDVCLFDICLFWNQILNCLSITFSKKLVKRLSIFAGLRS